MIIIFILFTLVSQLSDDFFLQALKEKLVEIEQRREQMTGQSENIVIELDLLIEHRELTRALTDSLNSRKEILYRDSVRISNAYEIITGKGSVYDSLLSEKFRELYKHGNPSAIEVFLSEETFSNFVNRMEYLSRTTEEIIRIVESTRDVRDQLGLKLDSLNSMISRLNYLQNEIVIEESEILRDSLELTVLLLKLDSSITTQEHLRIEINQAAQEISRQLAARERARVISSGSNTYSTTTTTHTNTNSSTSSVETSSVETSTPLQIKEDHYFERNKGSIMWPLKGEIISSYRQGAGGFGNGIDIAASTGVNIVSVAEGRVTYAQRFVGWGNVVMIDHGDGYVTMYCYLSSPVSVEIGQRVNAGHIIGSVGENPTGDTKFHFEIRIGNKPVNPIAYLQGSN